jgi:hypothetical protein
MGIKRSHADRDSLRKAEPGRPFSGKAAYYGIRSVSLPVKLLAKASEQRIYPDQKLFRRQPSERLVPHGLMSRGAAASLHTQGIGVPTEKPWNPVAVLGPGKSSPAHFFIFPQDMENLGPEPLRGIHPALILSKIRAAPCPGGMVYLRGFFYRGMVFPKNKLGVGVILELFTEAQGQAFSIHRARSRAGGIDRDSFDHRRCPAGGFAQGLTYSGFQALDMILRVLAEAVFRWVTICTLAPEHKIMHCGANFPAVFGIYNDHADRVSAEIYSDNTRRIGHNGSLPAC